MSTKKNAPKSTSNKSSAHTHARKSDAPATNLADIPAVAAVPAAVLTDVPASGAPAAAPAKVRKPRTPSDKPRKPRTAGLMNYQAAQVVFLIDGLAKLQQDFAENKVTRPTLKRAVTDFNAKGRAGTEYSEFGDWVGAMTITGERGRKALLPGQSRRYKAQLVKNTGVFLRAPLAAIGAKKGDEVDFTVSEDGKTITISLAAPAPAVAAV